MCHIQHSPDGNGSEQDTALLCCCSLTCHSRMERIKISFGEGLKQLLLQEKETLKRQGNPYRHTAARPKAGNISSSEEKGAFPALQTIFLLSFVTQVCWGGGGGGSSSNCWGQTTFARELFHMSKRLAGVVSLSDISAALLVHPVHLEESWSILSKGAVCKQRGGKPSYVIFIPDHSSTLSSSKVNVTC